MANPDPESIPWLRVFIAFAVVFGLMGLMGYALKYVNLQGLKLPGKSQRPQRLAVVETLALDLRRRLVIVRCDGKEHLLLLGANQDIVVEANLDKNPTADLPPKSAI